MEKPSVPKVLKVPRDKPPFNIDCLTQINADPLLTKKTEAFDFDTVCRNLDNEPDEPTTPHERMAQWLREVLYWLCEGTDLKIIGIRAVAAAKFVCPDALSRRVELQAIRRQAARQRQQCRSGS